MEIFGEVGAKMGPRWRQDGPSWQQVAPKMGHDSAKMTMLGSVWELLGDPGSIFGYFFRIFGKTTNSTALLLVFWGLGPPPEGPGGCLGRVLGAMLEDVGSKMVFFWLSWAMLWHLGAKMAHKSAKARQDNHQMMFEVKFAILLCVFDIGASKTLCFTRVRFLKHCALPG